MLGTYFCLSPGQVQSGQHAVSGHWCEFAFWDFGYLDRWCWGLPQQGILSADFGGTFLPGLFILSHESFILIFRLLNNTRWQWRGGTSILGPLDLPCLTSCGWASMVGALIRAIQQLIQLIVHVTLLQTIISTNDSSLSESLCAPPQIHMLKS